MIRIYDFDQLSPEEILNRDAGRVDDPTVVGKLITNNRWYFAANLPVEVLDTMRVGTNATLRFTGDFDQDVEMRLDYVSAAEGDVATAVFSTDRYLGQTTLLRFQSAELVFHSYSGLRIPKQALHMVKYEVTDEETGTVSQNQVLGVYILMAGKAEFKPWGPFSDIEIFEQEGFVPDLADADYVAQLKARMQDRLNYVEGLQDAEGGFNKLPDDAAAAIRKVVDEANSL